MNVIFFFMKYPVQKKKTIFHFTEILGNMIYSNRRHEHKATWGACDPFCFACM